MSKAPTEEDALPQVPDLVAEALGARRVLSAFLTVGVDPKLLTASLRPLPDDYGKVFRPEIADGMRQIYDGIWATEPVVTRKVHQTALLVHCAMAEGFMPGNPMMDAFPGGYAGLAPWLVEGRVWACWKFVAPGQHLGMAWDGLVNLDGRWAWFPRPWAFLRQLQTN